MQKSDSSSEGCLKSKHGSSLYRAWSDMVRFWLKSSSRCVQPLSGYVSGRFQKWYSCAKYRAPSPIRGVRPGSCIADCNRRGGGGVEGCVFGLTQNIKCKPESALVCKFDSQFSMALPLRRVCPRAKGVTWLHTNMCPVAGMS